MKSLSESWNAMQRVVREHDTKIRFLISGGANTMLGLGLFPFLYFLLSLHINYILILLLANLVCVGFAFLTNKLFVFRTSGNYIQEFGRFVLFHLSHIALSLVAVPSLVEFTGVSPVVTQPFFAVAIVLSSYFWHRHITFKAKKELPLSGAPNRDLRKRKMEIGSC